MVISGWPCTRCKGSSLSPRSDAEGLLIPCLWLNSENDGDGPRGATLRFEKIPYLRRLWLPTSMSSGRRTSWTNRSWQKWEGGWWKRKMKDDQEAERKELPPFYHPWMEIANQLSYLIENHQLRSWVDKMPLLSTQHLQGYRELALAHMALSFITMGYIWQEGEKGTVKVLPRNVAVPFAEISQALGLPPILVHMDFVLVNWKKKDPSGPLDLENLEPIICSPGGDNTRAFILVTFLVEKAAAPGIKAVVQAVNSLLQPNNNILEEALQELAKSMKDMLAMMKKMHDYVDPDVFYAITRLFFSGWKENPVLPGGLTYEGVCEEPLEYSGASAAQSSTLQAFDELLGIHHSKESSAFLHGMRAYMPPHHRAFIQEIQAGPSLRRYIVSSGSKELYGVYNQCVAALVDLRTYHVAIVTKFITIAGINARAKNGLAMRPASFLEGKGTGGSPTGALHFLKNVRDTTKEALLNF